MYSHLCPVARVIPYWRSKEMHSAKSLFEARLATEQAEREERLHKEKELEQVKESNQHARESNQNAREGNRTSKLTLRISILALAASIILPILFKVIDYYRDQRNLSSIVTSNTLKPTQPPLT